VTKFCCSDQPLSGHPKPRPQPRPLHKNFLYNMQEIFLPIAAVRHPGGQSEPGPGARLFGTISEGRFQRYGLT